MGLITLNTYFMLSFQDNRVFPLKWQTIAFLIWRSCQHIFTSVCYLFSLFSLHISVPIVAIWLVSSTILPGLGINSLVVRVTLVWVFVCRLFFLVLSGKYWGGCALCVSPAAHQQTHLSLLIFRRVTADVGGEHRILMECSLSTSFHLMNINTDYRQSGEERRCAWIERRAGGRGDNREREDTILLVQCENLLTQKKRCLTLGPQGHWGTNHVYQHTLTIVSKYSFLCLLRAACSWKNNTFTESLTCILHDLYILGWRKHFRVPCFCSFSAVLISYF